MFVLNLYNLHLKIMKSLIRKGVECMEKITLKALRVNKGLTLKEAADGLKISVPTLSSWENGNTFPKVDFLPVLEDFYGVEYNKINFFTNNHSLTIK